MLVHAHAIVEINRPARYGKQLVQHLSRRSGGSWDESHGEGWMDIDGTRVLVATTPDALTLQIDADDAMQSTVQEVVARHLLHFAKEPITISWQIVDEITK
jgi:hypothetical protein